MIKLKDLLHEKKDHEGSMAKSQLERSKKYAMMIYKIIQNVDKDGDGVEPHEFMKQCPCFNAEIEYASYQPQNFKPKTKKARELKKSKSKK